MAQILPSCISLDVGLQDCQPQRWVWCFPRLCCEPAGFWGCFLFQIIKERHSNRPVFIQKQFLRLRVKCGIGSPEKYSWIAYENCVGIVLYIFMWGRGKVTPTGPDPTVNSLLAWSKTKSLICLFHKSSESALIMQPEFAGIWLNLTWKLWYSGSSLS